MNPLKTLSVVQGSALTRTLQGIDLDGTVPTTFTAGDTLTGTVWLAQSEPAVISFAPTWVDVATCQFTVSLTGTQTATLAIDTAYNLQVFATRSGTTYCIGWVYLQVLPAAGTQAVPSPVDLVTGAYVAQLLAPLGLSSAQLESIPTLITAASSAIRRWCNDRDFDRRTYTEDYAIAPDGWIRVNQVPINQILRAQATPTEAITIANTSSSVQLARCYFATTGDVASGLVITGLQLTWVSNGVANTPSPILFNPGDTVNTLATAINAVGFGWKATANSNLGAWPVTELIGGLAAQGCAGGPGASLQVYADDLDGVQFHPDDGARTGLVWVGRQSSGLGPRWGPGWYDDGETSIGGTVRLTYDAGFTIIPAPVQLATAELAKAVVQRAGTDFTVASESAGAYSYTLMPLIQGLPLHVLQGLSPFRLANA